MRKDILTLGLAAALALSGAAHAVLIDNGDGTVSDDVTGLMWTKDANLAASNIFGLAYNTNLGDHPQDPYGSSYSEQINTDGKMTWGGALHWIDAMNSANYLGYSDWRLPTVTDLGNDGCNFGYTGTDCGFNVDLSSSELADLYYRALGNLAEYDTSGSGPQTGWGLSNTGPFDNLQTYAYWSGTQYVSSTSIAWDFITYTGNQSYFNKGISDYAWAVRSNDSGQVPLTGTLLLMGLGLAGLMSRRRYW